MDDELPYDETLVKVEAICQLADALANTSNKEIRARLLLAMDLVIAKLGPVQSSRGGSLLGLTDRV